MPYLEIETPRGVRRLELEKDPITVGRHPDNRVQLSDTSLSRRHCIVQQAGDGGWEIRDLGSRNGTRLNGRRCGASPLTTGDEIQIGNVRIRYIDPELHSLATGWPGLSPSGTRETSEPQSAISSTLDIDLRAVVSEVQSDPVGDLRGICESSLIETAGMDALALVDARGRIVHDGTKEAEDGGKDAARVFRWMVLAAARARATDLHIEPRDEFAILRMRVDGQMVTATKFERPLFDRLLGITKVLCEVDITGRATVQDGHFSANIGEHRVDYRVSLTPVVQGQKLVIRVLDAANAPARLHELGLLTWMYEKIRRVATRDSGMLLVAGPTGSGKTTTLHSCLREIDVESRNAVTIEDPVEYQLEGATQIPVDRERGHGFAEILRSVLRQDPDVILVGEVRDLETATVATQAAMTGHLVYSTVHARDSIGAIFRLLDLGLESYLVANALNLVMAQRLVRLLCPTCRRRMPLTSAQTMALGRLADGISRINAPQGCASCLETGYLGRRAIFELLEVTDSIRDIVLQTPTISSIRQSLRGGHFTTLRGFGLQLVAGGDTSYEEIERVAGEDGA